jgi:MFS family permease
MASHVPSRKTSQKNRTKLFAASAFSFVLIMGIVNLFADMTYEGASSINGSFLGMLGASAAAIGIIAGVGEFLGYCLRFPAGYISDKTGKYWPVTFVGYAINLLAVPALTLAGTWQLAGALVITERIGRAIRKPSVEAMLSYTTSEHGKGWVYSVNNALDQTGATLGPLLMALVLLRTGNYRAGYAVLLVSAVLALAILVVARMSFPNPTRLETEPAATRERFSTSYWLFMLAGACIAAGLVSFELISYHFSTTTIVTEQWIPIFFAVAMATNAITSLILGRTFDRFGIPVVIAAFFLSALFAPFVFFGTFTIALVGMVLWGIGFGAQDTLLKAIIAGEMPKGKRNLAFGLFYTGYGSGWLVGSVTTGLLYERSLSLLVAFSVIAQLASLPIFFWADRANRRR